MDTALLLSIADNYVADYIAYLKECSSSSRIHVYLFLHPKLTPETRIDLVLATIEFGAVSINIITGDPLYQFLDETGNKQYKYFVRIASQSDSNWRKLSLNAIRPLDKILTALDAQDQIGLVGDPLCSLQERLNFNWDTYSKINKFCREQNIKWPQSNTDKATEIVSTMRFKINGQIPLEYRPDRIHGNFVAGATFIMRFDALTPFKLVPEELRQDPI